MKKKTGRLCPKCKSSYQCYEWWGSDEYRLTCEHNCGHVEIHKFNDLSKEIQETIKINGDDKFNEK